jgi:hypothetical protein
MNSLILYESPFEKVRLGKDNDGGYIICDIPNIEYDIFISCGIDNDISFEESFCDKYKNVNCYAFDGTIDAIKTENANINFIRKNIDCINSEITTNLYDLIDCHKSIFIKMDIEGSEYKWLDDLSDDQLNRISQFVVEFHFKYDPIIFNKINRYFYLVHFHANNFCGFRVIENVSLPYVFECTYVNKKYFDCVPKLNTKTLPTELDMPNVKELYEYFIDFYPFVN